MASTRQIKSKILAQQTSSWLLLQLEEPPPPPPPQAVGVARAVAASVSMEMIALYFIFELIKALGKILEVLKLACKIRIAEVFVCRLGIKKFSFNLGREDNIYRYLRLKRQGLEGDATFINDASS